MEEIKRPLVLLAEDNKINQKLMVLMLGKLGADVTVVDSGEAAVEEVLGGAFDLVLMDLHMPGMDGLQATRRIREELGNDSPPIVALTADVVQSSIDEAERCGVNDYLTKPVNSEMLEKCLKEHIR